MKQQSIPADYALGVTESGLKAPDTFVLKRGNPHVLGEKVEPSFPRILDPRPPRLSPPQAKTHSTGRRLTLPNWIASADNPATARVMVDRVWQHHFGRGIVRSPNNFGYLGDRPTHPELLDWLAAEFVKNEWHLKSLHRLIVTSSAYRMSSQGNPAALARDPANDLFWRFDMRRLSAEEIRDSIHALSGRLNSKMYGPSVSRHLGRGVGGTIGSRRGAGFDLRQPSRRRPWPCSTGLSCICSLRRWQSGCDAKQEMIPPHRCAWLCALRWFTRPIPPVSIAG
jgi:hypothetical protein